MVWAHKTGLITSTSYWGVCTKSVKWTIMYMCVRVFILSYYVFYVLVPYCYVRYDFRIIYMMFGLSLIPAVCRRVHVLFMLFVLVCVQWCPSFVLLYIVCLYVLSSVLWRPMRFLHKNNVRFVFTSNCLYVFAIWVTRRVSYRWQEPNGLPFASTWVHSGYWWVRVANLVGVFFVVALILFVWCFVCPMLPVSPDCLFLIAPSVFSNEYLQETKNNNFYHIDIDEIQWFPS